MASIIEHFGTKYIMDIISEFLGLFLQMLFWYFVGAVIFRLIRGNAEKEFEKEKEALVKKVNEMIHRIKQEQHGDCYYWFDADNDQFLAQGRNDEEIRQHLLKRFSGHIFLVDNEKALAGPELRAMPIQDLTKKS